MKSFQILSLALLFLITACSSPNRESLQEKIKENESRLFDQNESFKFDKELAQATIEAYGSFVENYPKDSLTPAYLFKKADLHRAVEEYEAALDIYKRLEAEYSDYDKTPHSLFLQGFVYENEVGDMNKAAERYQAFLEKYPDHELADDVKFSLENLGKSPEDIIKEFEQRQQQKSAAARDSVI